MTSGLKQIFHHVLERTIPEVLPVNALQLWVSFDIWGEGLRLISNNE
jgi:hypothetical protein